MGLFFLTRLAICGIKNIENPIEFVFYKKTINNDFNPDKYRIKAIYGENGSGKTAVVTAVHLLKKIIEEKDYLKDSNTQKALAGIVNKKTKRGFVEIEFISEIGAQRLLFKYSFSIEIKDDSRFYLTSEKLEYKKGTYSKNYYITEYEVIDGNLVNFEGTGELFSLCREKTLNLLDQQSFISSFFAIDNITDKVLFNEHVINTVLILPLFSVMINVWIDDPDNHTSYFAKKELTTLLQETRTEDLYRLLQSNRKVISFRDDEILIPKTSINAYSEKIGKLSSFIKIFKPELKEIKIERKDHGEDYKCNLIMVYDDYSLDKEFESRGIKKLMDLYDSLNIACSGGIAFIDELDSNINDIYLDKLIEYFMLFGNGQLCFTAHNLSPMSIIKDNRNAIDFISSINSVHTWTKNGNLTPERAYRKGFIDDSPFNVDATDFIGILGKVSE